MEAFAHKFPNADRSFVKDSSDGLGPQLVGTPDPPFTEADATAECVLIDAEVARTDGIRTNSRRVVLKQKLETADAASIIAYLENNITNLATAKDALIDMALLIALDRRD